jgi:hypothetical protein
LLCARMNMRHFSMTKRFLVDVVYLVHNQDVLVAILRRPDRDVANRWRMVA